MGHLNDSLLIRALIWFYDMYMQSYLFVLVQRVSKRFNEVWAMSFTGTAWKRDGKFSEAWTTSRAYKYLTKLITIVPRSLGKLRDRDPGFWERSAFVRAVWYCGESSYALLSWVIFALLVIPQENWNNFYGLYSFFGILVLFYLSAMRNKSALPELKSIGVYPVAFAAFTLLFVFLSYSKTSSLRYFSFHFTCMLAVLLIVCTLRSTRELRHVLAFTMLGLLGASLCAIYQRLSGVEVNPSYVDVTQNMYMPGRVYSFFENPNSFASVLLMFAPMALALTFGTKGWGRLFYAVVFIAATAAIIMTYTRGAWVGYAFSILVLSLILKPALVPVLFIAGIFALPLMPSSVFNRVMSIFNFKDTSISSRQYLYDAGWRIIRQNPAVGVGLGSDVVKRYLEVFSLYKYKTPFIHTHNIYLQITCEMGVFALAAFVGSMMSAIKKGIISVKSKRATSRLSAVIAGAVSGLSGTLLFAFTDYPWSYPRVMLLFWILFAFLLSAVKLADKV